MRRFICGAIAMALFLMSAPARANPLLPGTATAPDVFTGPTSVLGLPVLASISGNWATPAPPGATFGTYTADVRQESGGTLDFVYQVTNNPASIDSTVSVSMQSFGNFTTDVGYEFGTGLGLTNTPPGPIPLLVDRSLSGNSVRFTISILPGTTSALLVIKTDATTFSGGNLGILDGGTANVNAFAPAPLPSTASLGLVLIGGLGGVGGIRRLNSRRALA